MAMGFRGMVLVDIEGSYLNFIPLIFESFIILLLIRYLQDFALLLLKSHCHILVSSVSLTSDKTKLGLS